LKYILDAKNDKATPAGTRPQKPQLFAENRGRKTGDRNM
jgi:hypothetical protein